uniref:Very-long-chain (3R)-3-hydroxyacyl-CoA dehydratase n=1 Tax=Globodera pallida TaxID=36090 RepID=A0A183C6U4_GLOPA
MIDKFDDRSAATAAASMNHHQETNPGNMHDDQNISGVLGLISALLDLRRWISLAIAFYFCSMNVIVVPVACLCTLGLFLLPLKLISMSLFNRLEHELCRLVNDAWMSAGKYCGLNIVEYGDDITRIANKRALCIVNHLGLLDHFCLMTSFHDKGSLAGKYMWVIFNIWQWNPVGAMWTAHGNFFVYGTGVGDAKRAEILKVFKRYLQKNYWKYNYGWIVMYPEGSRLFLIKKTEQRFCAKEGLVPFRHCTHPRVGAAHAVLQICGPKTEQGEDSNTSATKNASINNTAESPPVEYIVDVTLGYHRGVVPQFARSLLGIWPFDESGNIAVYYRIHRVKKEWCEDADLFREWLYEQYRKKDQLLAHFYKTGNFLSNADDSNSAHLRGRPVDVSDLRCLLVQIVWLALFYFHFNMWIRPMSHFLVDVDVLVLDGGRSVEFSSFGLPSNSQKECKYAFRLPLYDAVQESPEVTRVDALHVEFRLSKTEPAFWGNGILSRDAQKQAHHWLKFDFEKWTDDPDDQSADEEADNGNKSAELKKNQYMERLMKELDLEQDKLVLSEQEIMQRVNMLFSSYLFLYNIGMFIFTFYILCSILANYVSTPKAEFLLGFWSANFRSLLIITVLQSLDALHAFTRLTSAGYKASLIQVSGRLAMLMIINGCPPRWQWPPVFTLILAYLFSEQFRYPYYALKTLGISLPVVTWLRYNMWLLLYPLGFFLEGTEISFFARPIFANILGLTMLGSAPFYYESGVYSLQLPNAFNFSYNFGESPEVTRVDALHVEFRLSKTEPAFWGNGILSRDAQKQAHHWLKFDFEKWTDDPDDQSADEEADNGDKSAELKKNQYMERLMKELNLEQDKLVLSEQEIMQRVNMFFSSYLFLYNIGMFIFTFYILCSILANYVSTPKAEFLLGFWSANFRSLLIVTVLQSLDALHAFTRLTSAGYKASLIQVSGRLAMLMIINGCPPCWQWPPVFTLILAYLFSEQFRYPYYALKTLGISLPVVTWLRYNMWLLLYPLGFFLEGLTMLGSAPFYYESGVYSLHLPNAFNFSYNFGILLPFFTFTFFPFIGFTLIKHMLKQRKSKMEEMRREEALKRSREKKRH